MKRELGFIFLPPTTLGSSESYQQERGVRHMKRKYIWKMLTLSSLRLALVTRSSLVSRSQRNGGTEGGKRVAMSSYSPDLFSLHPGMLGFWVVH